MALRPHSVETPVEKVLGALRAHGENPKRSGDGYASRCPAHEDSSPSLSVSEGRDGSCLVHCHANCDPDRIISELGLQWDDLFPPKAETNGHRKIVATYDYTDENGELLYQKVRYDPKDFRQRKPDGNGGWLWKLGDTRQVLYRLPIVEDAAANTRNIYLVEGEKDVHAIEKAGAIATTSPLGAGKWRDEFTTMLDGAIVTVISDRDDAGRAHARMVSAKLGGALILEPASGKDVADHLAEGLTLDDLQALSEAQVEDEDKPYSFAVETWAEFRDHTPENIDYLVEGLIAKGSLVFLASEPKAGKTWLALSLAVSISTGSEYLERFSVTTPASVLYLALEGHRTDYRTRLGAIARGHDVNPSGDSMGLLNMSYQPIGLDLMNEDWAASLKAEVERLNIKAVFVDVLRDGAPKLREDGQGSGDFSTIKAHLKPLLKSGVTIVLVHHFSKRNESNRKRGIGEMMSGSGSLYGAADLIVGITTGAKEWENMRVDFVGRNTPAPDPFRVQTTGNRTGMYGGFSFHDSLKLVTAAEDATAVRTLWLKATEISEWIKTEDRLVKVGELVKRFNVSKSTINDHDDDLETCGIEHVIDFHDSRNSGYQSTVRHRPAPSEPDGPFHRPDRPAPSIGPVGQGERWDDDAKDWVS